MPSVAVATDSQKASCPANLFKVRTPVVSSDNVDTQFPYSSQKSNLRAEELIFDYVFQNFDKQLC